MTPTFTNPSQEDIDQYASEGRIVDVTLGNNQLVWGGFQEENAKDIAAWLQGDETFEECLAAYGREGRHQLGKLKCVCPTADKETGKRFIRA